MEDLNKTISGAYNPRSYSMNAGQHIQGAPKELSVTIFDGLEQPKIVQLNSSVKTDYYFGRSQDNDIVLNSAIVSGYHGRFRYENGHWVIQDKLAYSEKGSTNGLIYNNAYISAKELNDGDFIRIDDGVETIAAGVLFVFSASQSLDNWDSVRFTDKKVFTIGREDNCDIVLKHVSVSRCHAMIVRENDGFYIVDNNSTNGVIVNNMRVTGKQRLHEKDVIAITNSKLIFTSPAIYFYRYRTGISVDASNIVIKRGSGRKSFITCNHVNLNIKPGELVAIIGGSGAGKSTILNCMCGYLEPAEGDVYINGIELYKNIDSIKKMIGYVPQSDIVFDNLTLYDMLKYTAKLRLPEDCTQEEREAAIDRAIAMVELTEKKKSFIKSLSGGQRKRASIAVELLSDPKLLFLDEPASGLDPGTERNLMKSLRAMADGGKTVILVTHSTLQLQMCDKIVFMGKGGNLCFYGSYDEALKFFGTDDVVNVYNMITDNAPEWSERYRQTAGPASKPRQAGGVKTKGKEKKLKQLAVLCSRYVKLVFNDRQRSLLLLAQAPILAFLISLVAKGDQFKIYNETRSILFALACCGFWIGMLNAIQEICKERSITKREYMTGLSLSSYVASKIIVLSVLCLIQSLLVMIVFSLTVGLPDEGLMMAPFIEMLITVFLSAVSASAMGLMVSSLFTNADRAMTVAPILLMPQILFSGIIFPLEGVTEVISWFTISRWSMEGLGTTANLNDLPMNEMKIKMASPTGESIMQKITPQHAEEAFYEFEVGHMLKVWLIMIAITLVCLVISRLVLSRLRKDK